MTNRIEELLHMIEVAVYGEEVREAIHDSIAECYVDVTTSATAADAAASAANTAATNATNKAALAASAAEDAADAASAANAAATSASTAASSATTAAGNVTAAITAANTAASNADQKATLANQKATAANSAASAANTAASSANAAASAANTAASNADQKATLANQKASAAQTAASTAISAADAADTARASATAAASSATSAASAANTAATSVTDKLLLVDQALTDIAEAIGDADDAAQDANSAAASATSAALSANTAATNASNAGNSATTAASSANSAATSANSAATSAGSAATSATNAANAANAATAGVNAAIAEATAAKNAANTAASAANTAASNAVSVTATASSAASSATSAASAANEAASLANEAANTCVVIVEDAVDQIDQKADIDGYYEDLYAGTAGNLIGRGDATREIIVFRPTSSASNSVEDGSAVVASLLGNTIIDSDQNFVHFSGSAIKSVGFNQFDISGITEDAYIDPATGSEIDAPGMNHSDYIRIDPSQTYYTNMYSGSGYSSIIEYDIDKNFLGSEYADGTNKTSSYTFTPTSECAYIIVNYLKTISQPCLNFHHSGYRDGEYEDYWSMIRRFPVDTYFPTGMKSTEQFRDELKSDRAITRIGVIDLSELSWRKAGSGDSTYRYATVSGMMPADGTTGVKSIYCNKYATLGSRTSVPPDGAICPVRSNGSKMIYLVDRSKDSLSNAEFAQALSGVNITYLLENPTEVLFPGELNMIYQVSDFGSEELITSLDSEQPTSPLVADIAYVMNAADTIRNLPQNYISKDSMTEFITALGAAISKTITMEWDENNRKYTFTIT